MAELARALGPTAGVVSSPLRRALATAQGLGRGPVAVDQRWVEIDYGELEGRPLADVPGDLWRRWRADPTYRPSGGESLAEVGERVRAACEELFGTPDAGARDQKGDVVVVSHVSPIKAAVAWSLGVSDAAVWRLFLSTGSVTRIGFSGGTPILHSYNERPVASTR